MKNISTLRVLFHFFAARLDVAGKRIEVADGARSLFYSITQQVSEGINFDFAPWEVTWHFTCLIRDFNGSAPMVKTSSAMINFIQAAFEEVLEEEGNSVSPARCVTLACEALKLPKDDLKIVSTNGVSVLTSSPAFEARYQVCIRVPLEPEE